MGGDGPLGERVPGLTPGLRKSRCWKAQVSIDGIAQVSESRYRAFDGGHGQPNPLQVGVQPGMRPVCRLGSTVRAPSRGIPTSTEL